MLLKSKGHVAIDLLRLSGKKGMSSMEKYIFPNSLLTTGKLRSS